MREQQGNSIANQPRLPPDLIRFCQRLHKAERGKIHLVAVHIPEKQDEPITWTFLGSGKTENKG